MNWTQATDVTEINAGDWMVSASGVEICVTKITLGRLNMVHRNGSGPSVMVTYDYNDNGHKGTETVSIENFLNNLHS